MHIPDAVTALERDLRGIFSSRLQSVVVYAQHASAAQASRDAHDGHGTHGAHGAGDALVHTLVVVDAISHDDLRNCATHLESWQDAGLDTPLLVAAQEFGRSLDVFPYEFGAILADHVVAFGTDPFSGLQVETADLRRACEVQARGHLLHLREGYLETRGRNDALAYLIEQSAPAFAALVRSVAHLDRINTADMGAAARHVERRLAVPDAASRIVALTSATDIASADAERLFPPYLETVERLVKYVDSWVRAS